MIAYTLFIWAIFQLYIASNVPFWLTDVTGISVIVTNSNARLIHLAFGFFLGTMAFPLFKSSPKDRIPWYDWVIAIAGVACCLYIVVLRNEIADRAVLNLRQIGVWEGPGGVPLPRRLQLRRPEQAADVVGP